jgi:hypothetical protein
LEAHLKRAVTQARRQPDHPRVHEQSAAVARKRRADKKRAVPQDKECIETNTPISRTARCTFYPSETRQIEPGFGRAMAISSFNGKPKAPAEPLHRRLRLVELRAYTVAFGLPLNELDLAWRILCDTARFML